MNERTKPCKTRVQAVAAVIQAVADVPAGAWDPHAGVYELRDGSGFSWDLHFRTGFGNTVSHVGSVDRWDRSDFMEKVLAQVLADPEDDE